MKLPRPKTEGRVSLEQTILRRRTVRTFADDPMRPDQLGQLVWAAQGVTGPFGTKRAAPSAGALYPMDVYAVAGAVGRLEPGVYHYAPRGHGLRRVKKGDVREALARASLGQAWMADAPADLVITAEYERITGKYGRRGVRYAMIEAGHIGQNIFLQAVALGLAAGIVGAFDDRELARVLSLPRRQVPLLVMPVGTKR